MLSTQTPLVKPFACTGGPPPLRGGLTSESDVSPEVVVLVLSGFELRLELLKDEASLNRGRTGIVW